MNNKVSRKMFLGIVKKIRPAISAHDFLPILNCVCFSKEEIYAFNDVMRISFPNNELFPFEGAIPGDLLLKALNSFNTTGISCSTGNSGIKLSAGKSRVELPFYKSDLFVWDELPENSIAQIKVDGDFITGLQMCAISISQDVLHPEHAGVQLSCDRDDELFLHSTDNSTVSQYKLSARNFEGHFDPVVLPEQFCKQVIALAPEMKSPILNLGLNSAWVNDANTQVEVFSKFMYRGGGVNFLDTVEGHTRGVRCEFYRIEGTGLINALNRSLIVGGDRVTVTAQIEGGNYIFDTETEKGQSRDELLMGKSRRSSQEYEVSFYAKSMLRAAKSFDKVAITKNLILFKNGKQFLHLIATASPD